MTYSSYRPSRGNRLGTRWTSLKPGARAGLIVGVPTTLLLLLCCGGLALLGEGKDGDDPAGGKRAAHTVTGSSTPAVTPSTETTDAATRTAEATPAATTAPVPARTPSKKSTAKAPYYANCDAVRRAGKAPLRKGQAGYRAGLDRDGDGVACESSESGGGSSSGGGSTGGGSDSGGSGSTYYANCDAVRAAGKAPLHRGDPGYSRKLDRDNDGIACE